MAVASSLLVGRSSILRGSAAAAARPSLLIRRSSVPRGDGE